MASNAPMLNANAPRPLRVSTLCLGLATAACSADDTAPFDDAAEASSSFGDALEDDDALDDEASDDETIDEDEGDEASSDEDDLAFDRPGSHTRRGPGARATIAASLSHTCAVRRDGTVRCWGLGTDGQLGNGAASTSNVPVTVSGLTNVVAVATGNDQSVALRSNGTVWRWGVRWGLAGTPSDDTPVQVAGLADVIAVAAGSYAACAVRGDGRVLCWGSGELGDGATTLSDAPVLVSGITNAIGVDVGSERHACALLATGTVKCWGWNDSGELGDGTFIDRATPVQVSGLSNAVDVNVDARTSCAALADGTVKCWGSNAHGLLGLGSDLPNESNVPVQVVGLADAEEVRVGWKQFACALLSDGTMKCWGSGDSGQLGNGMMGIGTHSNVPVAVQGFDDGVAIAAGAHACALRSDGTARCWGSNIHGELGNGGNADSSVPVVVSGFTSATDGPRIATGPHHTCALRNNGTVKCWGDDTNGQLGTGAFVDTPTPTTVPGLSGVRELAAGGLHTCAVMDTGTVKCWGRNVAGELGDGGASGALSATPVDVVGIDDAVQVAAASQSSCAVRSGGTVSCWGSNVYGQLGDGSYVDSDVPVTVSGLTNVVAIDMNNIHVCALTAAGNVKCWGYNFYGQLGNGTAGAGTQSNVPVTVTTGGIFNFPLANAVGIAVGNSHSCAVIANGTARCWGAGNNGAIGDGDFDDETRPVTVADIDDAVDISAGSSSTCALRAQGGAYCWGTDSFGELGNGPGGAASTPQLVGAFPFFLGNAIAIDSGFDNTCVAKGDGTMSCWGLNGDGQLGDGTNTTRTSPVAVVSFP